MNELIAYCGLDCERCDAYIALINNDDELRRTAAEKWCKLNNTDAIKPEHINCLGCKANGIKTVYCEQMCGIRKCVLAKGFSSCSECQEKSDCSLLAPILQFHPEAKENIGITE